MLSESVLTQRDSIRKLILQVKVLAKSLQKLQNHQCLSEEIGRKPGPHGERAGELLEETHRQSIRSPWMSRHGPLLGRGVRTFRSSHSISSLGLFHSFSRSAYFFFSSFSFSRSCQLHSKDSTIFQQFNNPRQAVHPFAVSENAHLLFL